MSLDAIIDKKKVFVETKVLASGELLNVGQVFAEQVERLGLSHPFEAAIDAKT